ncbi:MAG: hypothetical protein U0Q15_02170 [Kineosporiaceae bacterium]
MERFPEGGQGVDVGGPQPVLARRRTSATVSKLAQQVVVAVVLGALAATSGGTVGRFGFGALAAVMALGALSSLLALVRPPWVEFAPSGLTVAHPAQRRSWTWEDCRDVTLIGRRQLKAVRIGLAGGGDKAKVLLPLHLDVPPERLAELATLFRHTYGGTAQG